MFYTLAGFVAFVLSTWVIGVSSYKTREIHILQEQIDSLVVFANAAHGSDTTLQFGKYIPPKTIKDAGGIRHIIAIHSVVFLILMLFIYVYIICIKGGGEKIRCSIFKCRKKRN